MTIKYNWTDFIDKQPDQHRLIIMRYDGKTIVGLFRSALVNVSGVYVWEVCGKEIQFGISCVGKDKGNPTLNLHKNEVYTVYTKQEAELYHHGQQPCYYWDYFDLQL